MVQYRSALTSCGRLLSKSLYLGRVKIVILVQPFFVLERRFKGATLLTRKKIVIHRMQIWRTTRSAPGTSMKARLVRPRCSVLTIGSLSTRTFKATPPSFERLRLGRGLLRMTYPGLPTLCSRRQRELSGSGGVVKVVSDLSGS